MGKTPNREKTIAQAGEDTALGFIYMDNIVNGGLLSNY
jgi:hypothetical protein